MLFFQIRKYSFYCFFSLLVKLFASFRMSEVLSFLYVFSPDVPADPLYSILALCAPISKWAVLTNARIGPNILYPSRLVVS